MKVDPTLPDRLARTGGFNASACINCGSCTALCPLGMGPFPRQLFRYVLLGAREEVVRHTEEIYSCLLCKMCEDNCPAGVHIAENVRTLRTFLGREELGLATSEV